MICLSANLANGSTLLANIKTVCAAGEYVVLTVEEGGLSTSPFDLSMSDAGAISGAVMLVWAVGFGIRMVIRAMTDSGPPADES